MPITRTEAVLRDNCSEFDSIFIVGMLLRTYCMTQCSFKRNQGRASEQLICFYPMDTVNVIMFPSLLWLLGNPGQWSRPQPASALDLLTNILHPNFLSPFIYFLLTFLQTSVLPSPSVSSPPLFFSLNPPFLSSSPPFPL